MTVTPAAYGGDDDVPVDGFGDVGRLVAHRVADLLHGYAVVAHDRHCGVPGFVGCQWPRPARRVILANRQLRSSRVLNQAAQTAKRSPEFAGNYAAIARRRGKK